MPFTLRNHLEGRAHIDIVYVGQTHSMQPVMAMRDESDMGGAPLIEREWHIRASPLLLQTILGNWKPVRLALAYATRDTTHKTIEHLVMTVPPITYKAYVSS